MPVKKRKSLQSFQKNFLS